MLRHPQEPRSSARDEYSRPMSAVRRSGHRLDRLRDCTLTRTVVRSDPAHADRAAPAFRVAGHVVLGRWGSGRRCVRQVVPHPIRRPRPGLATRRSQAVHEWQGLGITSRLYQHGAALQPDICWGVTTLTDQSAALRRRLHQIDPWRFAAASDSEDHPQDACLWCIERGWAHLDRTGFNSHLTDE